MVTKISPALTGLPTLASAFTANARPRSFGSVVPEPRQQDPGRQRRYGEADAGQEEERVEQPQRPEVAPERAVQPAQHGAAPDQ